MRYPTSPKRPELIARLCFKLGQGTHWPSNLRLGQNVGHIGLASNEGEHKHKARNVVAQAFCRSDRGPTGPATTTVKEVIEGAAAQLGIEPAGRPLTAVADSCICALGVVD